MEEEYLSILLSFAHPYPKWYCSGPFKQEKGICVEALGDRVQLASPSCHEPFGLKGGHHVCMCTAHDCLPIFLHFCFNDKAVSKISPGTCNGVCAIRGRAQLVEDVDALTRDLENIWKPGKLLCKAAGANMVSVAVSHAELEEYSATHTHLGLQYPTCLVAQVKGSRCCL